MRYYLQKQTKKAMRAGGDERIINYEWPNVHVKRTHIKTT